MGFKCSINKWLLLTLMSAFMFINGCSANSDRPLSSSSLLSSEVIDSTVSYSIQEDSQPNNDWNGIVKELLIGNLYRFSYSKDEGPYGVIDEDNNVIFDCEYLRINIWAENCLLLSQFDNVTIANWEGEVLNRIYSIYGDNAVSVRPFEEEHGWAIIDFSGNGNQHTTKGYVNQDGQYIIPPLYLRIDWDEEYNFARVLSVEDEKWGVINKAGTVVIPIKYEYLSLLHDGVAYAQLNGKYGFIDMKDNLLIPHLFEDADVFYHDLAAVKYEGKWGFINRQGDFVIAPQYDMVDSFRYGNYTAVYPYWRSGVQNPVDWLTECCMLYNYQIIDIYGKVLYHFENIIYFSQEEYFGVMISHEDDYFRPINPPYYMRITGHPNFISFDYTGWYLVDRGRDNQFFTNILGEGDQEPAVQAIPWSYSDVVLEPYELPG